MKRHVPTLVTLALIAFVAVAGAVFAFRAPALRPVRVAEPTPLSLTAEESRLTSAFSLVDTQASQVKPSVTPPKRVYDRPQRRPGTRRRLAAHNRDFDPAPPDYLLAQGVTRVKDAGMRVALTFDDGPSENTDEILSVLSRYQAHATFFMVGRRVLPAPQLARAVVAQGSEIGNHTMDHEKLWHATEKVDEGQILAAEDVIFKAAGVRPVYVRPKGGEVDDTGIAAIKGLGKIYVYWDVAGFDTVPDFTSAEIRDTVLEDARPGSVILLHETNPRTVAALPQILEGLHRKGYKVESLTELLAR